MAPDIMYQSKEPEELPVSFDICQENFFGIVKGKTVNGILGAWKNNRRITRRTPKWPQTKGFESYE